MYLYKIKIKQTFISGSCYHLAVHLDKHLLTIKTNDENNSGYLRVRYLTKTFYKSNVSNVLTVKIVQIQYGRMKCNTSVF